MPQVVAMTKKNGCHASILHIWNKRRGLTYMISLMILGGDGVVGLIW